MNWWEHVMLRFFPKHHPGGDSAERVDRAFARVEATQHEVAKEAQGVVAAATDHRERVEHERRNIRRRMEVQSEKHRDGQTSDVVALVNELLARPGLNGHAPRRDRP